MIGGLVIVLINAGVMALTVATETWYCLPINVACILIGLVMMARDA